MAELNKISFAKVFLQACSNCCHANACGAALRKLYMFSTVVKEHLFQAYLAFVYLSSMCREKNILSSRKLKKPRQCFVNLPGQTHGKTGQYLSPLCFEERSWKKCHQGRYRWRRQSGAIQQMNLLTLVTQIRKTNLLIEVTEERGNLWLALVLWTVALIVMWVTCSFSNLSSWRLNLFQIRAAWWLMSFYYHNKYCIGYLPQYELLQYSIFHSFL